MSMHFEAAPGTFKKAQELRENETTVEKLLWAKLSENQLGLKFRRQHPIKWFIADFYCHKAKLIIEVEGGVHLDKLQKDYDEGREGELEKLGLKVLRFTNEEILNGIEKVLETIRQNLILSKAGGSQP